MKLTIAAIILFTAAGAWALDLGAVFSGSAKPVTAAELLARLPEAPLPSAETARPGNCDFPVEIVPDEAHYFIDVKDPIVIDIRTPEEFEAGHLEAVDMQLDYYAPDFKEKLGKLDKDAKYLIYCRTGHRTGITLGIMNNMGFTDIHHIKGGITAWIADGWPVVQ